MKNFILSVSVLFFSLPVFCANTIKMVTYFPVPYASYQHLDVEKTLDVGVMSCAMDLTCPNNQYALNVYEDANPGNSVLKKGYLRVTSGRLDLNSSGKAVSMKMTVGNYVGSGGELDFNQSLRINTLVNRGQSLEASNDGNVVTALKMFPDHINNNFPACTNDNGFTGAPDVSWKKLEMGAQDGKAVSNVFLVCGNAKGGEAETPEPEPEDKCKTYSERVANRAQCCPGTAQTDTACWQYIPAYGTMEWNGGSYTISRDDVAVLYDYMVPAGVTPADVCRKQKFADRDHMGEDCTVFPSSCDDFYWGCAMLVHSEYNGHFYTCEFKEYHGCEGGNYEHLPGW